MGSIEVECAIRQSGIAAEGVGIEVGATDKVHAIIEPERDGSADGDGKLLE